MNKPEKLFPTRLGTGLGLRVMWVHMEILRMQAAAVISLGGHFL